MSSEFELRADVGRWADYSLEPHLRRQADEGFHVEVVLEVVNARTRLVEVPGDIGLNRVAAECDQFFQTISPVRARHAEIMDRARDQLEFGAVQQEHTVFRDETTQSIPLLR